MSESRAIWLLSDGRSGGTWFARLLACQLDANHAAGADGQPDSAHDWHVEHEPVHAIHTLRLAGEPLLPLPGSADLETTYLPLYGDVLAGRHRSHRFGAQQHHARPSSGIIIRDIHAMLIAPQLLPALPALRPAVIVRHPADVARSKLALGHWDWFSAVECFLDDPLLAPSLIAQAPWIASADNLYRRYVIAWAVCHRWLFASLGQRPVVVAPYPMTLSAAAAAAALVHGQRAPVMGAPAERFAAAWRERSPTDRPKARPTALSRLTGTRFSGWLGRDPVQRAAGMAHADRAWTEDVIDAFELRWLVEIDLPVQITGSPLSHPRAPLDNPLPAPHRRTGGRNLRRD